MMFNVRATSFLQEENIPASEMDNAKKEEYFFHNKVLKSALLYNYNTFCIGQVAASVREAGVPFSQYVDVP